MPRVYSATSQLTLPGPVELWADYPGLEVDEEAVYITMNFFNFLSYGAAYDQRLYIIHKGLVGGFYGGGAATVTFHDPFGAKEKRPRRIVEIRAARSTTPCRLGQPKRSLMPSTIRLHRVLRAAPERIYRAFLDPDAMVKWLPPNGFTAKVHQMDARAGGSYRMSFTNFATGKSHSFGGEYRELMPNRRISYVDRFDDPSDHPEADHVADSHAHLRELLARLAHG